MAEKKIIAIQREELLFLRKAILDAYAQAIESPGDKAGYDALTRDISEKLGIEAAQQRHSPGLLHKLMHDEGHNRDFLDTCYRYISDNQYDRENYLREIGLPNAAAIVAEIPATITQTNDWEQRYKRLLYATTILGSIGILAAATYYFTAQKQPIVWNMTTAWNAESRTQSLFLEEFVNEVKKETKGQLDIRIYPDFQLPTSNGHHKSKEEVMKALSDGSLEMLHSASYFNFKETPEAIMFSAIPFGKNYQETVNWMRKPKIKETLRTLFEKNNILTFQGGHSGVQYGGWYREMPRDSHFFKGKVVRFANFAGHLLGQTSIGASQKPLLRHQIEHLIEQVKFDVIEWQNPEEDVAMGLHLRGFSYYDRSHWNEPNSMFCFSINQQALANLPKEIRLAFLKVVEKMGEKKVFSEENPARQLAENTIQNTKIGNGNSNIKIFDMQQDCPQLYEYLRRQNEQLLQEFVKNNPTLQWLYEDYKSSI